MTGPDDHDDGGDIALAGEYVLHLLEGDARRAFEARLAAEPALRALVAEWETGLAPLADEIAPEAPPAQVKSRLMTGLFGAEKRRPRYSVLRILGGMAAAAALALVLIAVFLPPPAGPDYLAELAAEDGSLIVRAELSAADRSLTVARLAGQAAPGRVLELWLIAEGAPAPVSLGVLPEAARATLDIPDAALAGFAGGVLAISDEPPGGSPTGQPTGAVLAAGPVTEV